MKDQRALAYVNLFAVLGAIPKLCELDSEAAEIIRGADTSVCFSVKGGPVGTLIFKDGKCRMVEGDAKAKIKSVLEKHPPIKTGRFFDFEIANQLCARILRWNVKDGNCYDCSQIENIKTVHKW